MLQALARELAIESHRMTTSQLCQQMVLTVLELWLAANSGALQHYSWCRMTLIDLIFCSKIRSKPLRFLRTWQLGNHFPTPSPSVPSYFKYKIARLVCPRPLRPRAMSKPLKKTIRVSYSMGMIYNIDDIYI